MRQAWGVRLLLDPRWRPVYAAFAVAAVLHLAWALLLAHQGGDLAAQEAWATFARLYPGSAYDLAWYGGMHPVSYSAISPYVMAALGVRTTMVIAGTISAAVLAVVLVRSNAVRRPMWPALYGALALVGNAVSGRATFALGTMFGLAAAAVMVTWPVRPGSRRARVARGAATGALAGLATAASPVAGLFVGLVAGALWIGGRRADGLMLGLPPALVVGVSAWMFPFAGVQPMHTATAILPILIGLACLGLAPPTWRIVRIIAVLYLGAVVASWAIPSPVGSNVIRFGLLFGGVVLVAVASNSAPPRLRLGERPAPRKRLALGALVVAIATSSIWQVSTAADDVAGSRSSDADGWTVAPLLQQLRARSAGVGRVEAVPTQSHREAVALATHFNLARGWNRQADAERNPIFYQEGLLTAASYRAWLDHWAVRFVVIASVPPDHAAVDEATLVNSGLPYLRKRWSDGRWTLYRVVHPTPLADPPAVVTDFDADGVEIWVPGPATVTVRIPASPWLSLIDDQGLAIRDPSEGCLSKQEQDSTQSWTVLHATRAGTYRIAAPYTLPRGTPCPEG
jgi:hypothetical protein